MRLLATYRNSEDFERASEGHIVGIKRVTVLEQQPTASCLFVNDVADMPLDHTPATFQLHPHTQMVLVNTWGSSAQAEHGRVTHAGFHAHENKNNEGRFSG